MKHLFLALAITTAVHPAHAVAPRNSATTAIKEISAFVSPENSTKAPAAYAWMNGDNDFARISDDGKRIESFNIKTGEKTGLLIDVTHTREAQISSIEGFSLSKDGSKLLVYNDSEKIYRRSFKARYYVYDIRTRILQPLSNDFEFTRIPVFSPDGRMVAFVADNDIYIRKIDFNSVVRVTTDGIVNKIINGATDWTYEEEFSITSTLRFSPDNTTLCFLKFNETDVPAYSLPLYEGSCPQYKQYADYPGTLTYKYPVAGKTNSTVSLHSYDIDTRKTKDITLPSSQIEYIPRIDYGPTAGCLMVSTLNRDQNRYEIFSVNPGSTVCKSVFVETSDAWIDPQMYESITFAPDAFTLMSERTGFMHLYRYSYTGTLLQTLTSGEFDVTDFYGTDIKGNAYYQAALPTPMDRTLYRLDAKKHTAQLLGKESGTTSADFSPSCEFAVLTYSNTQTPPVYTLCDNNARPIRTLEDNSVYASRFSDKVVTKEFITVPSDGYLLNGFILRPADFNPANKYPLVMTQYSGPGSQSVLNRWEMDWMYYFVSKGFVVACVDGRGTGARGAAFKHTVYRNLGHYETIDQINAAAHLASLPGIDSSRIGMFGWSYGGYETLMCVTDKTNPFTAAVAVAPVTDWRYYDTVYAERYMLTPQQNDTGYNSSSPLRRVKDTTGNLLIIYGTADDNVHPANSLQFVSQLQLNGMACDMLVFPNKNHSIYGCGARAVVYGKMFDYFKRNL